MIKKTAEIKLWDVATGKELASFEGHSAAVTALAFSPKEKKLATGSADGEIKTWDVSKFLDRKPEK